MFGTCKGCHELAAQVEELKTTISEFQRRIAELEGSSIDALEQRIDEISFEWDKWYGKFRSLYANMARQARKDEPDGADEPINPAAAALLQRRMS